MSEFIANIGTRWGRFSVVNMTSVVGHLFSSFYHISPELGEMFERELTDWLEHQVDDGLKTDSGHP